MNIVDLLNSTEKIALIQNNKKISYNELLNKGLLFGDALERNGIKKGDNILVFIPLSIELYIAMIGTWSIGASAIFIDFSRGTKFVNKSIERLCPNAVICDNATAFMSVFFGNLSKIKKININKKSTSTVSVTEVENDAPAILTFTSGTTGTPKIAVRTHDFLINQYNVLKDELDFSTHHIDLGTLPVFTLASLAAGLTTLLPDKSYRSKIKPKNLAKSIDRYKVSRAICSPALMENMLKYSPLSSISHMYLGGGPVFPSLLDSINKKVDLYIVYGSTEAEPIAKMKWSDVTFLQKDKMKNGYGIPAGVIAGSIKCKVLNDEIIVRGETVLKGYLGGVGDGENKINENGIIWHKTGDAGFIDEDGILWLLGRVSQKIDDCYPFAAECVVNMCFGVRGTLIKHNKKRILVVENKIKVKDKDLLKALESFKVDKILKIKNMPMDKRHGAKVDMNKLIQLIK